MSRTDDAIVLQRVKETDFPAIMDIQAENYFGHLLEPEATLRARWQLSPGTTWVARDEVGVCAYLFGYRTMLGKVTQMCGMFEVSTYPSTLYLHDLAVSRRVSSRGVGSRLVRMAWHQALDKGMNYSSLVSLPSSQTFWERLGYRAYSLSDPKHVSRLASYPEAVSYMATVLKS